MNMFVNKALGYLSPVGLQIMKNKTIDFLNPFGQAPSTSYLQQVP
jgi:hypothetical protein